MQSDSLRNIQSAIKDIVKYATSLKQYPNSDNIVIEKCKQVDSLW
jgi:hypothetical protein